jgi:hypothetical protein
MEAGAKPLALERLIFREALADKPQHRHLPISPFDSLAAGGRQTEVTYVVSVGLGFGHKNSS